MREVTAYTQLCAVWQFGFNTPSPIEAVLEKEDVTLEEILAEDDLIQECKAVNPKLVDLCGCFAAVGCLLLRALARVLASVFVRAYCAEPWDL